MMTGTRKSGPARPWVVLLLLGALLAAGCSTSNTGSGLNLVDEQGNHPPNFLSAHPAWALPDGGLCKSCHGDDLQGGISRVSCFSASRNGVGCHANGPAFHPASWLNKAAGSGFHGAAYAANALINGLTCAGCHVPSTPSYNCLECHFNEAGTQRVPNGSNYLHGSIGGHSAFGPLDAPNATTSVCINCHATNNRFGHMPQPFCHNCHSPAPPSYHPSGWGNPDSHGPAAKAAPSLSSGLEFCRTCHGSNFTGGSVGVSCFPCHNVNAPHPESPWRISGGSARTHTNVNGGNAPVCFLCHAGGLLSSQPPPPPPPPGTPPGCFNNTLCHGAVGHDVPFLDPEHLGVTQAEFDNVVTGCSRCHAVSGTSPVASAPACQVCHTAGSPLLPGGSFGICSSCHGSALFPPFPNSQPNGTTYPNIAGAHAKHIALDNGFLPGSNVVDCDTCHDGLGFVTLAHYNRANARPGHDALRVPPGDLAFLGTYDAKSGPSSFDNVALTCTNVSCHGGQANLNWQTGTLDVNTQCTSCHSLGTAQFNSYNSGRHSTGAHVGAGCRACHNTTTLAANHFTNLATPAMEGPASATIGGAGTSVITYVPGGTPGTGSCTPSCHGTRDW